MYAYTGVGSRETPTVMLGVMFSTARVLARERYILRSGGAGGADLAFEKGCGDIGKKDIYLPWPKFNGSESGLFTPSATAFRIAEEFHPAWDRLSNAARKLMARNTHQVLGYDCQHPSKLLICWTKDGGPTGGTGQAIRIANHYGIPVFNLYNTEDLVALSQWFRDRNIVWKHENGISAPH